MRVHLTRRHAAVVLAASLVLLSTRINRAQSSSPFEGARIAHVGVVVRDPAAVGKMYGQVFGVSVKEPADFPGKIDFPSDFRGDRNAHPRYTFANLSDVGIEILTPVGGASPWREYLEKYGDGLHHICFSVKDINKAIAHLTSLGGTLELGGSPGVTYAYVNFRQQLGFTIELTQAREPAAGAAAPAAAPIEQAASALLAPRISHVGIFVPDVTRTSELFGKILGKPAPEARAYPGILFPPGFTGDPKAHPKIVTFPMNAGVEFAEPQGGASPWRDYVEKYGGAMQHLGVPAKTDLAATVSALEKMGGRVQLRAPNGSTTFVDFKQQPLAVAFEVGGPPAR